jgi:DUF4097 and DUF4098 domain-containing protein YvlB
LVSGNIKIDGYDGKEAIIEATFQESKQKEKEKIAPPPGMTRIASNSASITAREDNNEIEIETESWKRPTDLVIKVPKNFDLEVSTVHGSIVITNVNGIVEVSGVNGPVTLSQITGAILANTVNGELTAVLQKVTAKNEMSFVTLNGNIDVTLPADVKASCKMKSDHGDVFSDFDMKLQSIREEKKGDPDCDCEYEVSINSAVRGDINGGGPEFVFQNMHGNIIIRKGK